MSLNILLKWGLKLITRGFDNNNFIMILLHKVKYLYIIISAWKDKIILKILWPEATKSRMRILLFDNRNLGIGHVLTNTAEKDRKKGIKK